MIVTIARQITKCILMALVILRNLFESIKFMSIWFLKDLPQAVQQSKHTCLVRKENACVHHCRKSVLQNYVYFIWNE